MARKYRRDNKGRFAGGGGGATARGGRLKTASGNKRKTQTMQSSAAPKSTIGKPKGLKPSAIKTKATSAARRPDMAQVNIKGRFSGQAGKRFDASIDRAVKQTKAAQTAALMKPKAQVRAERAARAEANRAAQAAKPKRTRSVESLRASRAKQIEKRRSITTNPAGERASAAAKMAANAARTQQRAAAFYKAGGKPARAAAKPAATKGARLGGTRRTTRAAAVANTAANRTGQSKTLNRFNSRPVGTKVLNAKNQLVPSATRVPLRVAGKGSNESDRAFGRVATKSARARAAAKPARKVETSAAAISRRRARANAPRTSTYLNQRLNTNSVITRSAANAIYNRQGKVARLAGGRVDPSVARSGIGVMQGLSGSKRQRADQLREQARKRVVGGRRR